MKLKQTGQLQLWDRPQFSLPNVHVIIENSGLSPIYPQPPNSNRRLGLMSVQLARILKGLGVGFAVCLLFGCGHSSIKTEFPYELTITDESARASAAKLKQPTIAIRWPALVDPLAMPILMDHGYQESRDRLAKIGIDVGPMIPTQMTALLELLQTASTMYAAELYWASRRLAPNAIVVLEPFMIRKLPNGDVAPIPLIDASLPVDLVVDLWVGSMPHIPLAVNTFEFALIAAPKRSPGNCGLLATTDLIAPLSKTFHSATCDGAAPRSVFQSHYLLDGIYRTEQDLANLGKVALPLSQARTVIFPRVFDGNPASVTGLTPSDYVKKSRPATPARAHEAELHPYVENYARIAVSAFGVIQPSDESHEAMASYAIAFDKSLGERLKTRSPITKTDAANVSLLRRLAQKEFEVRSRRDEQIAREIIGGDFGRRFRQTRDEAYAGYNKRISAMWGTVLTASVMYGGAIQAGGGPTTMLSAANSSMDQFNTQVAAQGKDFIERLAPSLAALGEANVGVLNDSVTVPLADQIALRHALVQLYRKYRK